MGLDLRGDPVVKAMGGAVHDRAEAATVKPRGTASFLHAFDDGDVFDKDAFPQVRVFGAQVGVGLGVRVVEVNVFCGLGEGDGFQKDDEPMVALHAEEDVGVKGDVFAAGFHAIREVFEIGEGVACGVGELAVDQRALAAVLAWLCDVVVIFEAGVAV